VNNGFNFLTIAMCGEIADSFGRKKSLLIAVVGQAGSTVVLLYYTALPPLAMYGLTAFFSLGGGQFSFYSSMFAIVADMTHEMTLAERTKYFAILTVLLYSGLCAGPVGIGAVIDAGLITVEHSFRVSAGIAGAIAVLIVCGLTETRGRLSRTKFSWGRSNPLGGVYILSKNNVTIGIAAFQFFVILGSVGVMTIVPVIMLDKGFSSLLTATWQTTLFGAFAIGNILVVPLMTKRFGNANTMRFAGVMLSLFMSTPGVAFNISELSKPYVFYLLCIPIILGAGWDAPGNSLAVTITGPEYCEWTQNLEGRRESVGV
jgi:MFS family permease